MISALQFTDVVAWRPTAEMTARSNLTRFMSSYGVASLKELHRKAIDQPESFWNAVISDLDISFYAPYSEVLNTSAGTPWARWCVGGRLNIIHNCIDKRAESSRPAIKWEGEDASVRELTYAELAIEVNRAANGLRRLGVRKGDVVAIVMPMLPETVVAFFAIAKIGAIILPLFSGYGADAIAARLDDAGAACVITCDGYRRRGRAIRLKDVVDEAVGRAPSVRHVIVVPRSDSNVNWHVDRDIWWSALADGESRQCDSERTLAEDPLMVIYTSGTTGRPKGTVHTHCGFPIKAAQDLSHAFDLKAEDTIFWATDLGWMMGPWELFGATLIGASVALYEGALDYPTPQRIWDFVQRHDVSVLGVSPTLIRMLMRSGEPQLERERSTLRILGSTGEPWDEKSWWWFFEVVGQSQLPIINYAGGTEISGGILGGNVISPMKPCAFAGPLPGMATDVVDEAGHSIVNQVGELAIRRPWIGMTRGFWHDPERYMETYWSRIKDVWLHGDWALVDAEGFWYLLGRSDDTIKVAGKRVGPAEIESVLTQHPMVAEAAVIGIPDEVKGQALACFCVRVGDAPLDRDVLRDLVVRAFGRALTPGIVEFVDELPKTRNGKVMRRVICAAFLAHEVGDITALDNPHAVARIRSLGIAFRATGPDVV